MYIYRTYTRDTNVRVRIVKSPRLNSRDSRDGTKQETVSKKAK